MVTVVCCGRDIECSHKGLIQRQKENERNVALQVIDWYTSWNSKIYRSFSGSSKYLVIGSRLLLLTSLYRLKVCTYDQGS